MGFVHHIQWKFVIGLLMAVSSGLSVATEVVVGGQRISIPAPESFSQGVTPKVIEAGEAGTIKEDRFLALFGTKAAIDREASGGPLQMERYALVQATRNVEPYEIPLSQFAKYKEQTKAQVTAGMTPEDRAELQNNLARTAKWLAGVRGATAHLGEPELGAMTIISETPTSLTMVVHMSSNQSVGGKKEPVQMLEGMSLMLVKSKVIWLQLYTHYKSRDDFNWLSMNILRWTTDVSHAN